MDTITITQLKIFAHHGVLPEETENGQDFFVNAKLFLDTRKAGETDVLTESVHYGEVCAFITEYMQKNTFQLLEAVAENTVTEVLNRFPLLRGIEFEICKPHAPIPLPFGNVSVTIRRMWHTAYIALGSNIGNREGYLTEAVEKLNNHPKCRVLQVSSLITTKPYGGVAQEDFLNGVLALETTLEPIPLLKLLNRFEEEACRERKIHWGPRTLDLDILFYDNEVVDCEELHIPHIDLANREFVLKPMCEIAPWYRHPINHMTVKEMLERLG